MATTNANLTITSDIINGMPINITKSMVMRKLGSTVGLEETSGLRTKKFTATDAIEVIEEDEFTNTKASKVYMRNTGSSKADFFYVAKHASAAAADTATAAGAAGATDAPGAAGAVACRRQQATWPRDRR